MPPPPPRPIVPISLDDPPLVDLRFSEPPPPDVRLSDLPPEDEEPAGPTSPLPRGVWGRVLSGKYSPALEAAFKFARTLDAPLDSIFDYPDEP